MAINSRFDTELSGFCGDDGGNKGGFVPSGSLPDVQHTTENFGLPSNVITEDGSQFALEILKAYGITSQNKRTYHGT